LVVYGTEIVPVNEGMLKSFIGHACRDVIAVWLARPDGTEVAESDVGEAIAD